jgi:hypothetical protein
MLSLYGPRRTFSTRSAAEAFVRHVTRELTAGGLPHWVEVQPISNARFLAYVHRFECRGGADCACEREEQD